MKMRKTIYSVVNSKIGLLGTSESAWRVSPLVNL